MNASLAFLILGLLCGMFTKLTAAEVGFIKINGPIGPATASYIGRAIEVATAKHHTCLIIQLDTPGGLLDSTKDIVQALYSSPVPTVVYVAPSGANATSAGCFITLAADLAAMAPNTSIGAAHPVSLSPTGNEKPDEVMKQKIENYSISYIAAIAAKRGRNVEWAKSAVRESASITAEEALQLKVIDLIARDHSDLLRQIHGRTVQGHLLSTAQARMVTIPMILSEKVFTLLWRPEVMFILMLVAIYGLIGELSNPGAILPGIAGVMALILVLYMGAVLPINVAGLALIGLAVMLFVIDVFAPTHGVLTFGGIAAFFVGSLMLFNRADPGFRLSLAYIIPGTLLTAAFFLFVVGKGLRAQKLPIRAGPETMLGRVVPALTRIDSRGGKVFVEGEYWNAVSPIPIEAGQPVEIVGVNHLALQVKPSQKP